MPVLRTCINSIESKWEHNLAREVARARNHLRYDDSVDGMAEQALWNELSFWSWDSEPSLPYVPSDVVGPHAELHKWDSTCLVSAPRMCQLCGTGYEHEESLRHHIQQTHGGMAEYRKRVLYLASKQGPTPSTGQEKRAMIQNF